MHSGQKTPSFLEICFQKYNSEICFYLLMGQMLYSLALASGGSQLQTLFQVFPLLLHSPGSPLWGAFHSRLTSCRKPANLQSLSYYPHGMLTLAIM